MTVNRFILTKQRMIRIFQSKKLNGLYSSLPFNYLFDYKICRRIMSENNLTSKK